MNGNLRVIKVGGSLFSRSELPQRLTQWLNRFEDDATHNLLIAGGDGLVDCVRQWHKTHELSEPFCHEISLRLMSVTSRLLQQWLPGTPVVNAPLNFLNHRTAILDCYQFAATQSRLEATWNTTSDSLAAEIAQTTGRGELWLLKSTLPETPHMQDWQAAGVVDAGFVIAAAELEMVQLVNLATPDLLSIRGI